MPNRDRPVLIEALPTPRRSRHPYQWCTLAGLMLLSLSQLTFGPPPTTVTTQLDATMLWWLNLQTVIGCGLCLIAAIIRDGWGRLCTELAGQLIVLSVFVFYLILVWQRVGISQGLSLGLALVGPLGIAAGVRSYQIIRTMLAARGRILTPGEAP